MMAEANIDKNEKWSSDSVIWMRLSLEIYIKKSTRLRRFLLRVLASCEGEH